MSVFVRQACLESVIGFRLGPSFQGSNYRKNVINWSLSVADRVQILSNSSTGRASLAVDRAVSATFRVEISARFVL
jgi:hypothetical protein